MPSFYRTLLFCSVMLYAAAILAAAKYGQPSPAAADVPRGALLAPAVQTMAVAPAGMMEVGIARLTR